MTRTTILGVSYAGRPMMNSLADRMLRLQEDGQTERARALLDGHNRLSRAFGGAEHDLAADFTQVPMEGTQTYPTVERIEEKRLANGWNRWAA